MKSNKPNDDDDFIVYGFVHTARKRRNAPFVSVP